MGGCWGVEIKSSGNKGIGSVTCQARLPISSDYNQFGIIAYSFYPNIFASVITTVLKTFIYPERFTFFPRCFCYTKMLTSKDTAPTQAKNTLQYVLKAPRVFLNRTTLRICKIKNNKNNNKYKIHREVELYIHHIQKSAHHKTVHENCVG